MTQPGVHHWGGRRLRKRLRQRVRDRRWRDEVRRTAWRWRRAVRTVRDGDWNDPATWEKGRVPGAGEAVVISHHVRVPYPPPAFFDQFPEGSLYGR